MLASNMWIQHDSTIIDTRDLDNKPEISPTTVGLNQLICVSLVERWILCWNLALLRKIIASPVYCNFVISVRGSSIHYTFTVFIVNANNQPCWKRLISADSPKPWDLSLGRWTASLQSPVKNAGWSWLVCKSGYPEIHPNPAIVIISVPLKTPGIQWYLDKTSSPGTEPLDLQEIICLDIWAPQQMCGFRKATASDLGATVAICFFRHWNPQLPVVPQGVPRCPKVPHASDGVHMLSCDMLQHLQLFAADPGYAILGKPLGRPGFT